MTIKLSELKVKSYKLPDVGRGVVTLEAVGSDLWVIRMGGSCLNKALQWEYEPTPSGRTDAFSQRCRWSAPEDAIKSWEEYLEKDGRPRKSY